MDAEGEIIALAQAIAAVRHITIDALRKSESSQQQLSASRGTFESVTASSKNPLPEQIIFACVPYPGLQERVFAARLSVIATDDGPRLVLRIIKAEERKQEMAQELADKVAQAFAGENIAVLQGQWDARE